MLLVLRYINFHWLEESRSQSVSQSLFVTTTRVFPIHSTFVVLLCTLITRVSASARIIRPASPSMLLRLVMHRGGRNYHDSSVAIVVPLVVGDGTLVVVWS